MAGDEMEVFTIRRETVDSQISKLESIVERLGLYSEAASAAPAETAGSEDRSRVFVVHGHDEGAREGVARFIPALGFQPIILHERANEGRTVIEKVEAHGDVGFAVVLLTPDDDGCKKGGTPRPRARQNVVLELGYFIGRLGRKRVCALKRGELEIPSDFGGVVYEPFDASGGWKQKLGRELEAVGYEIDWNTVMRS
jgi:predicted nucleotide-binding protein